MSKARTPDKIEVKYKQVSKSQIDKIARSGMFEVPTMTGPEPDKRRRFFIFRMPGDFIEGFLGESIQNIRRNASYPIETCPEGNSYHFDGMWEIFANKIDHQIIKENQLIGALVRVEYIGIQHISHCRPRKVKRWFKIEGVAEVEKFTSKTAKKRDKT